MVAKKSVLLALFGLAGCDPAGAGGPVYAHIKAFETPPADSAFVMVYSPWGDVSEQPVVIAKSATEISKRVDGIHVTCTNMPCQTIPSGVMLDKPPPGVDHVEVKVEKDGYEPTAFVIPFQKDQPSYLTFAVLLHRKAGTP